MRRGIKEMDLILTAYADASLAAMSDADLSLYDSLLHENDQYTNHPQTYDRIHHAGVVVLLPYQVLGNN